MHIIGVNMKNENSNLFKIVCVMALIALTMAYNANVNTLKARLKLAEDAVFDAYMLPNAPPSVINYVVESVSDESLLSYGVKIISLR